jgi:hypothetical protein
VYVGLGEIVTDKKLDREDSRQPIDGEEPRLEYRRHGDSALNMLITRQETQKVEIKLRVVFITNKKMVHATPYLEYFAHLQFYSLYELCWLSFKPLLAS